MTRRWCAEWESITWRSGAERHGRSMMVTLELTRSGGHIIFDAPEGESRLPLFAFDWLGPSDKEVP
jgi:hypothetical protein